MVDLCTNHRSAPALAIRSSVRSGGSERACHVDRSRLLVPMEHSISAALHWGYPSRSAWLCDRQYNSETRESPFQDIRDDALQLGGRMTS